MSTPSSGAPDNSSPLPASTPVRRASALQRWVLRTMVGMYRRTGGRIGGRVGSTPVLLLTTTGRKSGLPHTVPIGYFDWGEVRFVVASNAGSPRNPAWYLNLVAHPEVRVETGHDAYSAIATPATGDERARLWNYLMETTPSYRRYQRAAREIPLVVMRRNAPTNGTE